MSGSPPRLVVLTGTGIEHLYVANALGRAHRLTAIVVDHGKPLTKAQRIAQLRRRYTSAQLASRVIGRALARAAGDDARREIQMRSVLGPGADSLQVNAPVVAVAGINTPAARQAIEALAPDALLVYGTGIVGGNVLALPTTVAMNMHTGISPHYRGSQCAFWPLYNGEPGMLGATVHECVADVDAGAIYRVAHAPLHAGDDAYAAFARCVEVGAQLYVDTVQDLIDGRLHGTPQDLSVGRVYTAAMKGWRQERVVRRKVADGLIRRYVEAQSR